MKRPSLLYMLLTLLLAAPGLAAPTLEVGIAPEVGKDVDILVWTPYTGPSLDWLAGQLDIFGNASDRSIRIEQFTLGELRKQMVVEEDTTRTADVLVGVPHDELAELVDLGLLADVSNYATDEYLADLPAEASRAFTYGNSLLGLPLTLEGPALIVNTELVSDLPQTYEEFLASAIRHDRGATSGFRYDFGNFYFSWAWLRSHGASIFSDKAGIGDQTLELSSDEAVAGALALQELRFGTGLIPAASDYQSAHEQFAAGLVAFTYNGPWAVAQYFMSGVPLTIMPVPDLASGQEFSGFMSVQGVMLANDANDAVAAANAAKWLVRSSAQLLLAELAGRIPASIRAVDALADDEILHGFGLALRNAEAVPHQPLMADVWQPMGRFLQYLDERVHTEGQLRELLEQAEREILGL